MLELLGIEISATRMKCAMLGLKIVKSAALGQPAEWEDEGETRQPGRSGDLLAAARDRSAYEAFARVSSVGAITAKKAPWGSVQHREAAGRDVDRAD